MVSIPSFLVKSERRDALKWPGSESAQLSPHHHRVLGHPPGENTISGPPPRPSRASRHRSPSRSSPRWCCDEEGRRIDLGELRSEMSRALDAGGPAAPAFLARPRRAETALFTVGYAEADTLWPLTGLIVGVLIARANAYLCTPSGQIDLAKFFATRASS